MMVQRLSEDNITVNVLGHGTHISHVESAMKNKTRTTAFIFQHMLPLKLAPALVTFVFHNVDMIPKTISDNHVPTYYHLFHSIDLKL